MSVNCLCRQSINNLCVLDIGLCALLFVFLSTQAVQAQSIASGLSYLRASQNGDGTWGDSVGTLYRDTTVVLDALARLGWTGTDYTQGVFALASLPSKNNDDLARQVAALAGAGQDVAAQLSELALAQNPDITTLSDLRFPGRGWGIAPGFGSSTLDTALALRAMLVVGMNGGVSIVHDTVPAGGAALPKAFDVSAGATDLFLRVRELSGDIRFFFRRPDNGRFSIDVSPSQVPTRFLLPFTAGTWTVTPQSISAASESYTAEIGFTSADGVDVFSMVGALTYLGTAQNPDGGWGVTPGEDSHLMVTAEVLRTLALSGKAFAPPEALSAAIAWLAGHRNSDGGYSTDAGASNANETALAAVAIGLADPAGSIAAPAAYLEATQLTNGSWGDDPYRTAVAVEALLLATQSPAPQVTSDGGAGPGQPFVTAISTAVIQGSLGPGGAGVVVSDPSAIVRVDPDAGTFSVAVALREGLNTLDFTTVDGFGRSGGTTTLQITRDSTLAAEDLFLAPGFNMVGLTLDPANPAAATDLVELLGPGVQRVQRLDATTGRYETLERTDTGFVGSNFMLHGLDSLIVIADAPAGTSLAGRTQVAPVVDLVAGVNGLTIPNPPLGLDAFQLLGLIGDDTVVSSIQRFDPVSAAFETAVYHGGLPAGVNFPIVRGVSYLVSMRQPVVGFGMPTGDLVDAWITTPVDGTIVRNSPIVVSGVVSGNGPFEVTVADIPATVSGTTFTATVPLNEGLNVLAAVATDAGGRTDADAVSVVFEPIDFTISRGGSVTGSRTFTGDAVAISQVAGLTETPIGVPAGVTYSRVSIGPIATTAVQVNFEIAASASVPLGIHEFEVEYQLLDTGGNPVGPLYGNRLSFRIEVTP